MAKVKWIYNKKTHHMVVRKLSVFLLVIAFHVVVLGVVYMATRSAEPEDKKDDITNEIVENKEENKNTETPKKEDPPDKVPSFEDEKPKYEYLFHTVAKGDYLSGIATKYKVSTKTIMDINNLKDANKIFLGQKLKIPVSN